MLVIENAKDFSVAVEIPEIPEPVVLNILVVLGYLCLQFTDTPIKVGFALFHAEGFTR